MIKLRKALDVIILSPMVGLVTGILCSATVIVVMGMGGCIPRDPAPGRSPDPYHSTVSVVR